MSFTTVDAVAAHYPGFQRGVTNQNPSDAQIQTWIDNQAARITAVAAARGFDLTDLETTNPQAYTVLALINENGAAADLGDALFSLLRQGTSDKLFVSAARTEDVYPAFSGIAGQETDPADPETDSNLLFRKSDVY